MNDAQNRVLRTAGQAGTAASIVVVGEWGAQQAGWHNTLPTAVAAAMAAILTSVGAWVVNRKR